MAKRKGFSYSLVAKILKRDASGVTWGIQSLQADNPGSTTRWALLKWLRNRLPQAIKQRGDGWGKNTRPLPVNLPLDCTDEELLAALGIPDPGDIQLVNKFRDYVESPAYRSRIKPIRGPGPMVIDLSF